MECSIKQIIIIIIGSIIGEKYVFDLRKPINEIHLLKKFKKTAIPLNAKSFYEMQLPFIKEKENVNKK